MNDSNNSEYFRRRHHEFVARAAKAREPGLARVYRDFAEHYAGKAAEHARLPVVDSVQPTV